jgi:enamine deaminase RidA (YjgF/YER057c/UK114 family)
VRNDVYKEFFAAPYPARATICGGLARKGALVEVEGLAVAGARDAAIVAVHA